MIVPTACFACATAVGAVRPTRRSVCARPRAPAAPRGAAATRCTAAGESGRAEKSGSERAEEELRRLGAEREMARMRSRLSGLFGRTEEVTRSDNSVFDGRALRDTIKRRWGVQFDIQPAKIHGRVYVQIMWRYFEQQSFYLAEDDFASHCEAVAQMLNDWAAVDYFVDYVSSIKKRRKSLSSSCEFPSVLLCAGVLSR